MISSQFNDAHIVVYPLRNGLFRVQIFSKTTKVPPFGPLCHGMVVSSHTLPFLTRLTALNANRARRYNTQGYGRPYPTRQKYIDEIIERQSVDGGVNQLLTKLF